MSLTLHPCDQLHRRGDRRGDRNATAAAAALTGDTRLHFRLKAAGACHERGVVEVTVVVDVVVVSIVGACLPVTEKGNGRGSSKSKG